MKIQKSFLVDIKIQHCRPSRFLEIRTLPIMFKDEIPKLRKHFNTPDDYVVGIELRSTKY